MNLRTPVQPDDLAAVRTWFDTLAKHCRAIDYEGARPIFADDMIAFGTFTDFMIGRELAEQKQWRNVWGTIRNFRFDLDTVEAIVSADRLTAIGMGVWQSDGFHPNGDRFDRPGRTTVVPRPQDGGRSVRRHPHPHVAVPRHAGPQLRQVRLTRPQAGVASFNPTIPATISAIEARRIGSINSPNRMMPRMAVPTAPMPVQTA